MATFLRNENLYRILVREFISNKTNADIFSLQFIQQWQLDRDEQYIEMNNGLVISKEEMELSGYLDTIFTACDSYTPKPEEAYEINEKQLWQEARHILVKRWGEL